MINLKEKVNLTTVIVSHDLNLRCIFPMGRHDG